MNSTQEEVKIDSKDTVGIIKSYTHLGGDIESQVEDVYGIKITGETP